MLIPFVFVYIDQSRHLAEMFRNRLEVTSSLARMPGEYNMYLLHLLRPAQYIRKY